MSIFGVGPERYSVSAMMAGASFDDEQEQAAQQAVEPERQPDIVEAVDPISQTEKAAKPAAKRKYTKRAK